jgi:RNA polymerase sigma-70 factor (ECF subfamily)
VAAGIIGDRTAAEDVVQEAAMHALGKLDQFEAGTNFRAWMAQMVRYVALNHRRRRQKHRAAPLTESVPAGDLPPADGVLEIGGRGELSSDQMHFDDRIMAALNSVGDVARACLLLRTIEQMDYADISKVLGIPEGTAMSHVHRTRQHLRERLAGLGKIVEAQGEPTRNVQGEAPRHMPVQGARKGGRP